MGLLQKVGGKTAYRKIDLNNILFHKSKVSFNENDFLLLNVIDYVYFGLFSFGESGCEVSVD